MMMMIQKKQQIRVYVVFFLRTMRKQKLLMMLCADCTAEEAKHVLAALDPIKWIRNEVTPPLVYG